MMDEEPCSDPQEISSVLQSVRALLYRSLQLKESIQQLRLEIYFQRVQHRITMSSQDTEG